MKSWKRSVIAIAGTTLVVELFMVLTGMGPNVVLVAALCVLIGVGLWFISETPDSTDLPTGLAPAPENSIDHQVMWLRSGLVFGQHYDTPLERLRASLVELVDDQLRTAHQIDRVEDPDSARAVIGDDLYAFVNDPKAAHELARPRELDRILTLIEQI